MKVIIATESYALDAAFLDLSATDLLALPRSQRPASSKSLEQFLRRGRCAFAERCDITLLQEAFASLKHGSKRSEVSEKLQDRFKACGFAGADQHRNFFPSFLHQLWNGNVKESDAQDSRNYDFIKATAERVAARYCKTVREGRDLLIFCCSQAYMEHRRHPTKLVELLLEGGCISVRKEEAPAGFCISDPIEEASNRLEYNEELLQRVSGRFVFEQKTKDIASRIPPLPKHSKGKGHKTNRKGKHFKGLSKGSLYRPSFHQSPQKGNITPWSFIYNGQANSINGNKGSNEKGKIKSLKGGDALKGDSKGKSNNFKGLKGDSKGKSNNFKGSEFSDYTQSVGPSLWWDVGCP